MSNVVSFRRPPAGTSGLQTFAGEDDRRRLTTAALKAVLRPVDAWGASNAEDRMAASDEGTMDGLPLVREAFPRTVRLEHVSS